MGRQSTTSKISGSGLDDQSAQAATPSHTTVDSLLDTLRTSGTLEVDRARQVYCNRDINLGELTAIGFDMDYTLAPYRQAAIDELSVQKTLERLVAHRGYPDAILKIEPRPDFAIRGLVIDKRRGNICKLDSHRHVGKGYHGFRELTGDQLADYGRSSIRFNDDRFQLVDTLFALPEAFLYAALVDYLETAKPAGDHDWKTVYDDIRYCIDLAHRDSSIKDEIIADTGRYIERTPDLALTLHKFRSTGHKLFVLTNSYWRYTDHIMGFLLDGVLPEYRDWKSYFDVIVTGSAKPGFFTSTQCFVARSPDGEVVREDCQRLERGTLYEGGNFADFQRMTGFTGGEVLFIGDHIYGDIMRSRKSSAWRTAMIVQEMESELEQSRQLAGRLERIDELDAEVSRLSQELAFDARLGHKIDRVAAELESGGMSGDATAFLDAEQLRQARRELKSRRDGLRRRRRELLDELVATERSFEASFNPYWGLIFKMGNKNSILGEQVSDYACLYTSRVSNFLNYSPMHDFRAARQPMPHERR